ncbi:uncharacterized protein BDZ83DRAFT_614370 [Colletotrichum acutatum]|uniref:Uncharacterized protein n=1 Tax=Glomerella acutata TaxID=27357 RepID=A0AAD8UTN2_GLOAC|nr:uncharacterized protein BDZ83DRAFT_614370 [Colletotrichum acutatum]KAK1726924.1 hypothetical protein BDZ83DRAFT_614370 [Colletotrichum acutatum]
MSCISSREGVCRIISRAPAYEKNRENGEETRKKGFFSVLTRRWSIRTTPRTLSDLAVSVHPDEGAQEFKGVERAYDLSDRPVNHESVNQIKAGKQKKMVFVIHQEHPLGCRKEYTRVTANKPHRGGEGGKPDVSMPSCLNSPPGIPASRLFASLFSRRLAPTLQVLPPPPSSRLERTTLPVDGSWPSSKRVGTWTTNPSIPACTALPTTREKVRRSERLRWGEKREKRKRRTAYA